jgi:hypothetical protein
MNISVNYVYGINMLCTDLLATSLINYVYRNKYAMYSVARLYYRLYVKITPT